MQIFFQSHVVGQNKKFTPLLQPQLVTITIEHKKRKEIREFERPW